MNEFRITPQALVNTVIASGLVLLFSSAPFGILTTIGGITLLLILFSYDQGAQRSAFQSLAFAAVSAFPVTLAAGMLLQQLAGAQNLKFALPFTWLIVTVLVTAIDRARMGSRASAQPVPYPMATAAAPAPPPPAAHAAHAPRYGLGLGGPATAPQPQPAIQTEPHPAYTPPAPQPSPPPPPVYQAPSPQPPPVPVYQPPAPPPPPAPEPVPEQTLASFAAVPPPQTAPSAAPPAPAVPVPNPAAVTIIHVNIIGQGISLLRPVQAEHLARDVYRIIEPVPEGERWKYETGQAVRCRKQKLSSGKALVAYEEVILQRVG